jgi:hypothetical protein
MHPIQKSSERADFLQKYLVLHAQREILAKRLNYSPPSLPPSTFSRSPSLIRSRCTSCSSLSEFEDSNPPPAPSHILHCPQHQSSSSTQSTQHTLTEITINKSSHLAVTGSSILGEFGENENKLNSLNEQIKCTLTDLLNCEGVRCNEMYRMWVQTRLMDTEKGLIEFRRQNCERRDPSDARSRFSNLVEKELYEIIPD